MQSLIVITEVSRRRKRKEGGRQKDRSFKHFAPNSDNIKVKICLNAFLNLHAISVKRVKRLKALLVNNSTPRDNRGKCLKTHIIPDA